MKSTTLIVAFVLLSAGCSGGVDDGAAATPEVTTTVDQTVSTLVTTTVAAPTTTVTTTSTTEVPTTTTPTTSTTAALATGEDYAELFREVIRIGRESYDGPDEVRFFDTYELLMSVVDEPLLDEEQAISAGDIGCVAMDRRSPSVFFDLNMETLADLHNISSVNALMVMMSATAWLCAPDVAEDMLEALDTLEF